MSDSVTIKLKIPQQVNYDYNFPELTKIETYIRDGYYIKNVNKDLLANDEEINLVFTLYKPNHPLGVYVG